MSLTFVLALRLKYLDLVLVIRSMVLTLRLKSLALAFISAVSVMSAANGLLTPEHRWIW